MRYLKNMNTTYDQQPEDNNEFDCGDDLYGTTRYEDEQPYDGGGWPGDGSGMDDFADYNANEGYDY